MIQLEPNSYDINDERNDLELAREIAPLNMNYDSSYVFKKDSKLPIIEAEERVCGDGDSDVGTSCESSLFRHSLGRQITPSHVIRESRANRIQDSLRVLLSPGEGTRSSIKYKPHPLLCEGRLVWDVSVHPSKAYILSKEKMSESGGSIEVVNINSSRIRFERATSPPLNNMHMKIQCGNRSIPWIFTIRSEGDRPLHITICLLLEALYGVLQEPLEFYEWHCLDDKVKFDPSAIENKWSTHNATHLRLAKLSSPSYHISEEMSAVKRIDTLGNNTKFLSLKFSDKHGGDVRNPWMITLGPQ